VFFCGVYGMVVFLQVPCVVNRVEAKMEQLASDPGNPPRGWPCEAWKASCGQFQLLTFS
jgi:hypothetical protein